AKTKNKAIKVVDKVKFDGHYMLDHFKFLKEAVQKHGDGTQMPKFSIPSPNMLFTRIQGDEYYNADQDAFFNDTVQDYKDAIQAFYDVGCRYLQLDDTSWIDFVSPDITKAVVEKTGMAEHAFIDLRSLCVYEAIATRHSDIIITL